MALPSGYFNEVGGFTAYLLVILGVMYAAAYTVVLHRMIKDWRSKR